VYLFFGFLQLSLLLFALDHLHTHDLIARWQAQHKTSFPANLCCKHHTLRSLAIMPIPDYGAAPLAKTFMLARGLSLTAMICIVGLTANFVSEIVSTNVNPPREIVGTLAIVSNNTIRWPTHKVLTTLQTCLAAFYCFITIPFFYARANLGLFVMAGMDAALLLAFVVVSVVLGKPLSFLNCMIVANASAAANAQSASAFTQSLTSNLGKSGSILGLEDWAGSTRINCFETKAIWGLSIALCILFTCSSLILPTLWLKAKRAGIPPSKPAV